MSEANHAGPTSRSKIGHAAMFDRLPLLLAVLVAGIVGGLIARSLSPVQTKDPSSTVRPIVEIVREQPGLPGLATIIGQLCPSIAVLAPAVEGSPQSTPQTMSHAPPSTGTPAFAVSTDGWLVSAGVPPGSPLKATFGDGQSSAISEIRSDPISGLTVVKSEATALTALSFGDQKFPRVGDFGFTMLTPNGSGCSAQSYMISSDFLIEGNPNGIFLHLQGASGALAPGVPFMASVGSVGAVEGGGGLSDNSLLPGPLAATIVDELIRNSPSPVANFGFRVIDFTEQWADRVGNSRSRGIAVALVERGSSADQAGLKAGDVIVAVDSSPVASVSELSRSLDGVTRSASLGLLRGIKPLTLVVSRQRNAAPGV